MHHCHSIPGRLRVKIPLLKKNAPAAETFEKAVKRVSGVSSVSVNTVTGSAVMIYDYRATSADALFDAIGRAGYLTHGPVVSSDEYMRDAAAKAGGKIGKIILNVCLDHVFAGTPFGLITAIL